MSSNQDYVQMAENIAKALWEAADPDGCKKVARNTLLIVPSEKFMKDRTDFVLALAGAGLHLQDLEMIADGE